MSYVGYDAYRFLMTRVDVFDGVYVVGAELDIEREFDGLRYQRFEGLSEYGELSSVYEEGYAEVDGVLEYVGGDVRGGVDMKLLLCFFGGVVDDGYDVMYGVYSSFMDWVSGCRLIYRDTCRNRRVLMYLKDGVTVKSDVVRGCPYLSVSLTFGNVFGRSFGLDDMTIADRLGIGSYPVVSD